MTTQTLTLAEFLLARIAEDEDVARAAVKSPWSIHPTRGLLGDPHDMANPEAITEWAVFGDPVPDESYGIKSTGYDTVCERDPRVEGYDDQGRVIYPSDESEPATLVHIARHDPGRVLAECEAKRRIVTEHPASDEYDNVYCTVCQRDICCDSPKAPHQRGSGIYPCPTLRLLANVYADHPDFREEWRP